MSVSGKNRKSFKLKGGDDRAPGAVVEFQISKNRNYKTYPIHFAFLLTLATLFAANVAHAQYVSKHNRFVVDEIKGCAPFTITITDANHNGTTGECTGGKPCLMTFEPGQTCPPVNPTCKNQFTYTYTTPGTYLLQVLYQSVGPDTIVVTVDQNIQPKFELYTCSGNRVSLKVTDKNYDQYHIDFGDGNTADIPFSNNQVASNTYSPSGPYTVSVKGKDLNAANNCNALTEPFNAISVLPAPTINTLDAIDANRARLGFTAAPHLQLHLEIAINNASTFQLYKSLYGVSVDTATNGLLNTNYYCFRMSAYDACTGGNTYSNSICTQVFNVSAANALNKLAWNTSMAGITDFDIARNQSPYATTATTSYDDASVVCKTTYCYQIRANYANGSKSTSLEKCVDAFKLVVPPNVDDASAVVGGNQVALTWQQDPLFTTAHYSIYRVSGSGSYQLLGTSDTPGYTDPDYATSANLCYRVDYADECGNLSPNGTTICPIRLAGKPDSNNAIPLSWNAYEGWKGGVKNYTLEKFDKDGTMIGSPIDVGTQTSYLDDQVDLVNQVVSYLVTATPNDPGLANSVSNVIRVVKGVNLFSPTAFTPNGDSVNDGFIIQGQYINSMSVSIFDRWGTLIYAAGKDEAWNGTYNGKLMPETTYVWRAEGTDVAGQHFTQTGTVVLLKKGK